MKSIVYFHRCDLTDLFAPISIQLEDNFKAVHLAYSASEARRLRELGISTPITIFKDEIRRIYESTIIDSATLNEIDSAFLKQTCGAFNLNGAIQSDRGFCILTLDEAQRLTAAYYHFWNEFLDQHNTNIVLHEPCSLMFNFIAAILCSQRKGHYFYSIMAHAPAKKLSHLIMSGFDFTCPDLDRALLAVKTGQLSVDILACAAFLEEFRTNFNIFLGGAFNRPSVVKLMAIALKERLRPILRLGSNDRVVDNIDYWSDHGRRAENKLKNLHRYKNEVSFDKFDTTKPYYFYPLHLEPEAVVLYHSHGLYTNQIKLIENIAAQLPPGVLLYVKDHPHEIGYRSADDYCALKLIPNIRLLDASISGKQVIAHSKGVITITGTAGFEALLLGKSVFTFGKTFYTAAPGVVYVHNIRDLQELLYRNFNYSPNADIELYPYLTAYLHALRPGMTDYYAGHAAQYGLNLEENIQSVSTGFLSTIRNAL